MSDHTSGKTFAWVAAVACSDILDSAMMFFNACGPNKFMYQSVKERHVGLSADRQSVQKLSNWSSFGATFVQTKLHRVKQLSKF